MGLSDLLLSGAVDLKNDTLHARIFRSPASPAAGDLVSSIGAYAISDVVDIGARSWQFNGVGGGWRIVPPQSTYRLRNFNAFAASDGAAVAVLYRPSDGLVVASQVLGIGLRGAPLAVTTAQLTLSALAQIHDAYYGRNQIGNTWWGERRFLEGWINWTTRTWRVALLDNSWANYDQNTDQGATIKNVHVLSDIPSGAVVATSDPLTSLRISGAGLADDPTFPTVPAAGRTILHAALYADTGDVIRIITLDGSATTDGTNLPRMSWDSNPVAYFGIGITD